MTDWYLIITVTWTSKYFCGGQKNWKWTPSSVLLKNPSTITKPQYKQFPWSRWNQVIRGRSQIFYWGKKGFCTSIIFNSGLLHPKNNCMVIPILPLISEVVQNWGRPLTGWPQKILQKTLGYSRSFSKPFSWFSRDFERLQKITWHFWQHVTKTLNILNIIQTWHM